MQKVSERLARKLVRPAHAHAIPYRPDIDGLRAVAVWLVVFYHFGVPFLGGGYTGVDVFFVISGYLITTIILTQVQSGRFSLLQFYERRARRILPALFVVMAASTVAALALFIPADLVAFAESAAATTVFASNFYFNERSGYFSPAAELQPLLHTWSLAIEEQFYLIHPLALIVLARWRALPSGIVVALGVSFLVSVYSVTHHPTPAFYLLPARAWELSVGALLAIGVIAPPRVSCSLGCGLGRTGSDPRVGDGLRADNAVPGRGSPGTRCRNGAGDLVGAVSQCGGGAGAGSAPAGRPGPDLLLALPLALAGADVRSVLAR